jgi:hypothetical protein
LIPIDAWRECKAALAAFFRFIAEQLPDCARIDDSPLPGAREYEFSYSRQTGQTCRRLPFFH